LPNRYTLFLPHDLYRAMLAQARVEWPRECCGLLAGMPVGGIVHARRLLPLVNAAEDGESEFLSEPRSMFAAVKAMRAAGQEIVAVYHSHPTSEPVPSRKDCANSFSDRVMNLIISSRAGQVGMRGWWLSASGFEEGGWGMCGI